MKSILFVDDNQVLSNLSCDILRRHGYRAVAAYSGEEALAVFERETFDMVVTDLRMEGMDGLQFARAVYSKKPGLPIIMVTAYGPVEATEIKACLPKEGLFPVLLEQIRLHLSGAEQKKGRE